MDSVGNIHNVSLNWFFFITLKTFNRVRLKTNNAKILTTKVILFYQPFELLKMIILGDIAYFQPHPIKYLMLNFLFFSVFYLLSLSIFKFIECVTIKEKVCFNFVFNLISDTFINKIKNLQNVPWWKNARLGEWCDRDEKFVGHGSKDQG